MLYYVYILESLKDGDYYKGVTEDVPKRLSEHNQGLSKFTSTKTPSKLLCSYSFETKREALIEEKRIKRLNRKSINRLIQSKGN